MEIKDKKPLTYIVHMIGTAFLAVGLWRVLAYHLTNNHHLGLEAGILYWHFVDVVWLFLFYPYIIEDAKVK
jgi:heme/copper-type cytochrome/quinol oxidase subunit 3